MPETLAARLNEDVLVASILPYYVDRKERLDAYAMYLRTPSGRERPGRYWKIDLDKLDISGHELGTLEVKLPASLPPGVVCIQLAEAFERYGTTLPWFGLAHGKFAALTHAFVNGGALLYVPAGTIAEEPIQISYRAQNGAVFPYTLVIAEERSQVDIVESIRGSDGCFVAALCEVHAKEGARVRYASVQELPSDAQTFSSRIAAPQKDAAITWATADLGAHLCVSSIDVLCNATGIEAEIDALFFPHDDQHVDLTTTVDHRVGESRSTTLVKSAASGAGQARYLGNIRIQPSAHGTEANLKDDALLLSKDAHIDSVPALEIDANDVKAFHGATVGAIDEDQLFYMISRGLERCAAEKMIALGFFEPVIERFSSQGVRDRVRAALEAKVTA